MSLYSGFNMVVARPEEQTDEDMNRKKDRQGRDMNRQRNQYTDRDRDRRDKQMDISGQTDRQTYGQTDRQTAENTDKSSNGQHAMDSHKELI